MCGIAGFISLTGRRDEGWLADLGAAMVKCLSHRGPDDEGVSITADRRAVLAGTRLAVRDRSGRGHQPMTSPDGEARLVCNGEIYEYRGGEGHRGAWPRRSQCDTEELLQVLWHEDDWLSAVRHLNGMFAFAFHDQRRDLFLLARDHFGIKPLFFAQTHGGILFASEPSALFATGLVEPRLDPEGFLLHAATRMDGVGTRSWFRGVHALEPATVLVVACRRAPALHRFWTPPMDERLVDPEEVRDAFRHAVRIRAVSDVPRAGFLSGGLDSTSVLAGLVELGLEVLPFVVRYDGEGSRQNDDVRFALSAARTLGLEPQMCSVAAADLAELADAVTRRLHRPSLHGAELAMYASYRKVAESGRVVVYSGHGADEMWGYQDGRYFPILSPSFTPDMHSEYYLKHRLYRDERPSWHRLVQRLGAALGVPEPVVRDLVWEETFAPYRAAPTLDPTKRARFHLTRRFLVYVNEMVDLTSTTFSLEDRPVYQDLGLAELAFSLPEYVKNRQGPTDFKPFLKQALQALVPPEILYRPKAGFPAPDDSGYRAELERLVRGSRLPFGIEINDAEIAELAFDELLFLHTTRRWMEFFGVSP